MRGESGKLSGRFFLQHRLPMSNARAASSAVSYVPSQIFFVLRDGLISVTYLFSSTRYRTPRYSLDDSGTMLCTIFPTSFFSASRRRRGGACSDDVRRHFFHEVTMISPSTSPSPSQLH